ncbi:MAG: xylulokinase [Methylacidiphilales bacterium]|nr:xylulokinase [Candidatus Methylacidiphilales bacterium]
MIYLGIDCGTQSTKTIALDGDSGAILASAAQAYEVIGGLPPGHMEQDPGTWTAAVDATVAQVLEALGSWRSDVRGIGVSGQQHGFVPLDAKGRVIRAAKLWCDTSTAEECDLIRTHFSGSRAVIEKVGMDMLPGFTAPKILWLKRHEPENFAKLATVLLPHDYLNFYLTGSARMEYGDASGTALLDVRNRTWQREVVDFIDPALAEKLPPLGSSRQAVGTLTPELTRKWSLPEGVVVSAGGGDNMMGAIGTSNVSAGSVTASLGTSGTIYAYSEKPVIDEEGDIAGFCDSTDGWLPLICTMNVTVATEAARHLFGWSHSATEEAIRGVAAGSDGLLFLPYLQGERTPNLPRGTGIFHGLTTRTMTPAHMARATMEGVTLGLAYGLARMRSLGIVPKEIRLTGGGSKSGVWRQICADIFGCRVVTLAQSEGAALGAAIQALAAVQKEKSVTAWAQEIVRINSDETAEPKEKSGVYAAALEKQTSLMRTLAERGYL